MTIRTQRVVISIIGIVMLVGTLGTYFLVILDNNNSAAQQTQTPAQTTPAQTVDPTAYRVTGPVSTLQIVDLTVGTGAVAQANDTVRVHYKGTIAQTGVKFDSSYDKGEPLTISLSKVIKGWQDGIPGMKVGGKRRLIIPAAEAYGDQGAGTVPPNSDLVFEVELLAVNPK